MSTGAQKGVQPTGRAAAQDHVVGREFHALLGAEVGSQFFAGPRVAAVGHVAESKGFFRMPDKVTQALNHGRGHGQIRIAQTEVIDVFRAVACFELAARLEHAADPGSISQVPAHAVGKNRHKRLLMVVVLPMTIGYTFQKLKKAIANGGLRCFYA